ncbi:MAG: hypothetical protein OEW15_04750 [Nitrospirota bacterium]|nr:hypothetical protein [Nitrospirota bacterium]
MAYERNCVCGAGTASFHFNDNIITEKAITDLYCPACAKTAPFDEQSMVADNGWVIRYNMELARFSANGKIPGEVTPAVLFDEGFCTWNGMYPGDHLDSVREREQITSMAKTNPMEYIRKLKTWAVERTEKLKDEGWRKAKNAA